MTYPNEREEFAKWFSEVTAGAGHPSLLLAWEAGRLSRQKQDAELCRRYGSEYFTAKIEETP